MIVPLLIAAVVGYLLGALPFGYLVAKAKGVNIFEVGSKNPGATNVRRVLGHGPGNLVLILDAAKGALAVFLSVLLGTSSKFRIGPAFSGSEDLMSAATGQIELLAIAGLIAAILGHSFSCFTGFRGGKSVATGAGGFIVLFPPGAGIALVVFGITVAATRYISLGSMVAAITLPLSAYFLHRSPLLIGVSVAVAAFVVIRHRANISRLIAGTESKVGQKKETPK
ncbi:MAG: glycerol-3-phosphate 1-O-acyltransferase PlsY [Verrucomicrobia bacterium]|nr:glycerol-3-phosphate 1-O-acyltransferase PlsY [Verrucomicrobiota bacterium]